MLSIENVSAGYGDLKVLFDVSIEVRQGEIVALVGSNGAGKTTLLNIISGFVPVSKGNITFMGKNLLKIPAYHRAALGIAHIPQGRGILNTLTVKENLLLGGHHKDARTNRNQMIEEAYERFPILKERQDLLAGSLSGGQQQMLAVARALTMQPKLIMLDEPSLGLAPIIVDEVFSIIASVRRTGVSMLLIEQNLMQSLHIADRGYVLETGCVAMEGIASELAKDEMITKAYLGI